MGRSRYKSGGKTAPIPFNSPPQHKLLQHNSLLSQNNRLINSRRAPLLRFVPLVRVGTSAQGEGAEEIEMRVFCSIAVLVMILSPNLHGETLLQEINFDFDQVEINSLNKSVSYRGLDNLEGTNRPAVPFTQINYHAEAGGYVGSLADLKVVVVLADTIELNFAAKTSVADMTTSEFQYDISPFDFLEAGDNLYPKNHFEIRTSILKSVSAINITLFPIQFLGETKIILNRSVEIRSSENLRLNLKPGRPGFNTAVRSDLPSFFRAGTVAPDPVPLGYEFVIVTSPKLADSFEDFLKLKLNTGFDAAIAITDSIFTRYSGVDEAEALRNYLIDFYQAGGQYVLLGGDEDNVPIRYTYYYNSSTPPDLDKTMLNDLYFADVDGDWDYDGDGIFGEPTQDHPDMGPDIDLGRLPFSKAEHVIAYTNKLRAYLFGPEDGDVSYLGKAIFLTSDQMRDYFDGGQQYKVAENFPPEFLADCELLAEQPDGISFAPAGPIGPDAIGLLNGGYGMVNILAHGRPDGFVLSASQYNQFPKSYLLTGPEQAYHSNLFELAGSQKVGFYYSISCSQAMFDLDKLYDLTVPSVVEELFAMEKGGPVSMVAFSRWGWVGSSYKLMGSFYNHLFGDADGYPVRAMYSSWVDFPYYRDQIYSQNYYGDPSIQLYRSVPQEIIIEQASSYQLGDATLSFNLLSAGSALADFQTRIELDDNQYLTVRTNQNGQGVISLPEDYTGNVTITAYYPGRISGQITLSPSIIADANDDDPIVPREFALMQNRPNPFNPTSTIGFSLPRATFVQMEIYDILGRQVRRLLEKQLPAGEHEILFDGRDDENRELSSGIYFYRLTTEENMMAKKMTLLK